MANPPTANREPGVVRVYPVSLPGSTNNMSAATGANSAAVVTLNGTTGGTGQGSTNPPLMVGGVWWSYSGTPTGGRFTISDGTNNFRDFDITAAGPGFMPIDPPISLAAGTQLVATLAAGGSGVTGKMGLNAWQEL